MLGGVEVGLNLGGLLGDSAGVELRDAGFRVQPGHDPDVLKPGPVRI